MEEHITSMAGAQGGTCMSVETLQETISDLGRPYQQRDTLYRYLPMSDRYPRSQALAGKETREL
jgi:FO synthase subunit 2